MGNLLVQVRESFCIRPSAKGAHVVPHERKLSGGCHNRARHRRQRTRQQIHGAEGRAWERELALFVQNSRSNTPLKPKLEVRDLPAIDQQL